MKTSNLTGTNGTTVNMTDWEIALLRILKLEAARAGFTINVVNATRIDLVARNGEVTGEATTILSSGRGFEGIIYAAKNFVSGVAWAQRHA